MLGITLFATAEAYWLSYVLTGLAVGLLGWWVLLPVQIVLIVAMCFAADTLFNRWRVRFRYKVMTVIAIVILTAVVGDRLMMYLL